MDYREDLLKLASYLEALIHAKASGEIVLSRLKGLILGLSGGFDSTCLFHLLLRAREALALEIKVAHVAYGLRNEDSERDFLFIEKLCKRNNVQLLLHEVDAAKKRDLLDGNLQDKARKIRFEFFEKMTQKYNMPCALAHNANDQVETFFLNLLRGAGLKGLAGMKVVRGRYFRPLLKTSRNEIEKYLTRLGHSARRDKSNYGRKYRRNKIRQDLLPVLNEIEAACLSRIHSSMDIIALEDQFLDRVSRGEQSNIERREPGAGRSLNCTGLNGIDKSIARRILKSILEEIFGKAHGYTKRLVDELLVLSREGKEGAKSSKRGEYEIAKSRGRLYFMPKIVYKNEKVLPKSNATIDLNGFEFDISPRGLRRTCFDEQSYDERLCLSLSGIKGNLRVHVPKAGMRFYPSGGSGRTKVFRYLSNEKVPLPLRKIWPIVSDDGGILWIAGLRMSERAMLECNGDCLEIILRASAKELCNR